MLQCLETGKALLTHVNIFLESPILQLFIHIFFSEPTFFYLFPLDCLDIIFESTKARLHLQNLCATAAY